MRGFMMEGCIPGRVGQKDGRGMAVKESKRWFSRSLVRIVGPPLFIFLLFTISTFGLFLPMVRSNLMDTRRAMVREVTRSAWNLLILLEQESRRGTVPQAEMQARALACLETLRYGDDRTGSFWVCTVDGEILMNVQYKDVEGKRIDELDDKQLAQALNAAVEKAKSMWEGPVPNPNKHKEIPEAGFPRVAYVKLFEPWGWVIGTGVSVQDVRLDVAHILRHLMYIFLVILAILGAICGFIIWQGIRAERLRHAALESKEEQQQQLMQAGKMVALGTLVAGVAHEINNPNQHIMMSAGLLSGAWEGAMPVLDRYLAEHGDFLVGGLSYSEVRGSIREYLQAILDGSGRIRAIVEELRDFSRQDPVGENTLVDCNDVVRSAVLLLANMLKRTTRRFEVTYLDTCPPVEGNFRRLEQVVINLIQNACQALPDPDYGVRVSIIHDVERQNVVLEIHDEGVGIPKENLTKIFDPFFTTRRESGGSGLGLSVCARIVEEHHGTLTFDSEVGRGSTVRLTLPAARSDKRTGTGGALS